MTRLLALGVCALVSAGHVAADELRVINFTVTIASAAADKLRPEMDAGKLIATIDELEKANGLTSLTRIQFSTVENQNARFHAGETSPYVSGRSSAGSRGGPSGSPFGQAVSVSRDQTGTIVGAVARVVNGGVIAELEVEQTRSDVRAGGDDPPLGPKTATLSFKSAVRIPAGENVLLASLDERSAADARRTVVLVSAKLPEDNAKAAQVDNEFKVFALKNAHAEGLREVLVRLYPHELTIVADERTNAIIARGTEEQMNVVEALARVLDQDLKR
jgi:type II secretory pathway component GspD/PulD (secretin)